MNVVLDTNAYSDFRRFGKWKDIIVRSETVYLPLPVVAELRSGFRQGNHHNKNELKLQKFLDEPSVEVLIPGLRTTFIYADFTLQLKQQGTPIPTNDIWIAALVYEYTATLITSDSHFENLPQVLRAEL